MKNKIIICLLLFISCSSYGQSKLKELYPVLGRIPDLSQKAEDELNRRNELLERKNEFADHSNLSETEQKELDSLLDKYPETLGSIWDIVDDGCNWSESGGAYKKTASSFLKPQGAISYKPENAGDLNFATAWVPDSKNNGIGEYLDYYFKNESPRITSIMIFNGYLKSDKAWEENARVKRLELSINGKPYAILHLKDSKAEQAFKIATFGQRSDKKDLILRFKILETYPSFKSKDVAITQIYFEGLDVHCFVKGTKITMSDFRLKNIEDLKMGDEVLSYNTFTKKVNPAIILKMATVIHHQLILYSFEDGTEIIATDDHPFLITTKSWSSLNPNKSQQYEGFEDINKIEVGDHFTFLDKEGKLKSKQLKKIIILDKQQETYTITYLDAENKSFIANGFIVGTEEDAVLSN